jgi:hypothetical protein
MDKRNKQEIKQEPKTDEDRLDNALDDSFPASDPPAMTAPHRPKKPQTGNLDQSKTHH